MATASSAIFSSNSPEGFIALLAATIRGGAWLPTPIIFTHDQLLRALVIFEADTTPMAAILDIGFGFLACVVNDVRTCGAPPRRHMGSREPDKSTYVASALYRARTMFSSQ